MIKKGRHEKMQTLKIVNLYQNEIPKVILNLIQEMYTEYESQITHEGNLIEASKVSTGV
jgi:hypothetical protein